MKDFKFLHIVLIVFIVLLPLTVSAQRDVIEYIPEKELLKLAESAVELGDIYTAIEYYERYCELNRKNYDAKLELAHLLRRARNYTAAKDYYYQVYKETITETRRRTTVEYPSALFWYAVMLKNEGNYNEALTYFEKFDDTRTRDRYLRGRTDNEVEGCKMALKMMKEQRDVEINHLDNSINMPNIEFSPILVNDTTLIYGSLKQKGVNYYSTEYNDIKIPVRKFYMAKKRDETWKNQGPLKGPFNDPDAHTGNGAFSPDKKKFYFTRCKSDWKNRIHCQIYRSVKVDGQWQQPTKLGYNVNNPSFNSTMPIVGKMERYGREKEVLYFVSNMTRGSRGGYDIWYSEWDERDSVFDRPRNCGRRINTEGDEITPFYDQNNRTLYFSSDYWPGLGGFDVFYARGERSRFKKNANFGYPINSGADEVYFILNTKHREEGFFASNREGGQALMHPTCCDDLYAFLIRDYIHVAVQGTVFEQYELPDSVAKDSIIKQPLKDAIVDLYIHDKEEDDIFYIKSDTTDSIGNYLIDLERNEDYRLIFRKDAYFYKHRNVTTAGIERSDTLSQDIVYLERISKKPIRLFNVYYEFDKATLTEEAKSVIDTTLLTILEETPDIIVEISSHTDNTGDSLYNEDLSQRRAESVVEYLVKQGIDKNRLIAQGYGERKPVVPNNTREGRAKNRRTEFKVIGSRDPFSKLNVTEMKIIRKVKEKQEEEDKEQEEKEKKEKEEDKSEGEVKDKVKDNAKENDNRSNKSPTRKRGGL